jgi:hypothetical protein
MQLAHWIAREFVRSEMHLHDPDGFHMREPGARKVKRTALIALGPHHEWSGDGHDKLSEIGFPIWGMRDKWGSQWLGLWTVPNNRLKKAVVYLYLSLIKKHGGEFYSSLSFSQVTYFIDILGMPIQTSTDCGSETTEVFGLANALRCAIFYELLEAIFF